MNLQIETAELSSPQVQALILALNAELRGRYPELGANHFRLDAEEVSSGRGALFVAHLDGRPVGCGAVRRISDREAEVKRMYTVPQARGKGVGRAILSVIEDEARRLGVRRIVLETGVRQPEALALYRRMGFVEIPLFGEYIGSSTSVCLAKELT
jgi:GNAT superfamily N-acetyltransferase